MPVLVLNSRNEATTRIIGAAATFYSHVLLNKKADKISVIVRCDEALGDTEAETYWLDSCMDPKVFEIRMSRKIKNFRRIIQT